MKLKFLFIITLSLFLMIIISPLRGYGHIGYCSLIGFISYLILTLYSFNRYADKIVFWKILLCLFAGLWILQLPMRITYFESSLITLPDALIHTLGIVCGFFYWHLKKPFSILAASLGFSIALFMFLQGYDYWLHKLNFGTFTGEVLYLLPTEFEAFDESKNLITEKELNNKIVLLDFWHTRCGLCFEKFPQVQAVYEKYKNDSSVMILAVDKPIEEDKPNQAFGMIKKEGYSFPIAVAKDEDLPERFGVKGYPTTFVINAEGNIVFKGDIAGAVKQIERMKQN